MAAPYSFKPLKKPGLFHKLLRRATKANAAISINNLLSKAGEVLDVTPQQVQAVIDEFRISFPPALTQEREALYSEYLRHCVVDHQFSPNELEDLTHLKQILALSDQQISAVHNAVIGALYAKEVSAVVADRKVDANEREFLQGLQSQLRLPDHLARKLYREAANHLLESQLQRAVQDERLSPDEINELEVISGSLGVPVPDVIDATQLARYKLLWLIESGDIPEVEPGIVLQRGERCYFTTDVEWFEHRKVTTRVRYGGVSGRIKIAKGIYFRVGEMAVQRVTEDVLKLIDRGRVFLTNKRLIFMGKQKNSTIQLKKILDFTPFRNGVDIQKESGKSPFLKFDRNVDLFGMILQRTLNDIHA